MKKKYCYYYLLFFFSLIFSSVINISCTGSSQHAINNSTRNNSHTDTLHKKPAGSFSDTITISFPSAVFYNPDSLQLEKIKAITKSAIFESITHEFFYQMRNARKVLQQYYPAVKIVEVMNARYLLFKKANGEKICIDLDSENDQSGLFIFNGIKKPSLVDMTNIETELDFYFSK